MKELMQKALIALAKRKPDNLESDVRTDDRKASGPRHGEEWGMSPEDALRVGTVARYK
ncbi:hypothetical protein QQF73_07230 [Marinobacter sp. M216]|uniref:Uncharacterized protein n=1 Tax=Marinobacter albus TaxID=3030833 RepID=A0ABT7HAM5_9GAMM|nr:MULTISPECIES: hypothetical protein [unclassified Marinobacter]MBW7470320.1 hypothetical protein [Marinobacter sp. F4218]MDK9557415.1 hypothetical protein [Marinobacter sp. M216]